MEVNMEEEAGSGWLAARRVLPETELEASLPMNSYRRLVGFLNYLFV
jgi:hypothetical protein